MVCDAAGKRKGALFQKNGLLTEIDEGSPAVIEDTDVPIPFRHGGVTSENVILTHRLDLQVLGVDAVSKPALTF